eukprot:TRINITY_DN9548_c0_g2_i1.p1 TRINITY_DN9548_c0_g2~~TRINITY_DN9548_c0_g2_i1.p1  ORF type:complete len:154 (-),score=13.01 TRINITY_DN9548_c0_g2_i1:173-634(-)
MRSMRFSLCVVSFCMHCSVASMGNPNQMPSAPAFRPGNETEHASVLQNDSHAAVGRLNPALGDRDSYEFANKTLCSKKRSIKKEIRWKERHNLDIAKRRCTEDEACIAIVDWACDGKGFALCIEVNRSASQGLVFGDKLAGCAYKKKKNIWNR